MTSHHQHPSPLPASGRGNSLDLPLEESEMRYRRLFETAQDGILILDAESGKIIDVNPFLLDLLDFRFEDLVGLQLWDIGQFKDIAANREAFAVLQTNEYIRYEDLPLVTKAGKTIQVEFISNAYFTGQRKVIQCNIRDISGRTKSSLARERIALLEAAEAEKDKVIALLSHELRTPLTAISAMVDLVEMGRDVAGMTAQVDVPTHFDRAAVSLIRRNVGGVIHLANELLDVTRLGQGKIDVKADTLDFHEAIRFVVRNHESQRKAKLIAIHLHLNAIEHHISADPDKLQQVLTNLIGNAIKFTPRAGNVSIASRAENGQIALEISDDGIGIAPEVLGRIFNPFVQGDTSIQPRFGGLGLGLSIAQKLVVAQGGTLQVESAGLGQGTSFTLLFRTEPLLVRATLPQVRREPAVRILVVEENDDVRRCVCQLLEANGHQVRPAPDGKTARELIDWHDFDVLITDVALADGPGSDLLEYLRGGSPEAHGIALTAFALPEHLAATQAAGFVAHLPKPIEFPRLIATIENLVPAAAVA